MSRRTISASALHDRLAELHDELRLAGRPRRVPAASHRWRSPAPIVIGLSVVVAAALVAAVFWPRSESPAETPFGPSSADGSSPLAARHLSQLTFGAQLEQWPAWSPDGRRFVFASETEGFSKLFLHDLDSGVDEPLTRGDGDDIQAAWSPDGGRIAYVRANAPHGKLQPADVLSGEYSGGDIWILDLETREELKIVEEGFDPAFSPDGKQIALDASWAGPRRIWITDDRGRNPRQITTDVSEAVSHTVPSWSADGSHIVYQHQEKTRYDLSVVDVATGESTRVNDDEFLDLDPVWSASDGQVYFSSYRGGGLNIWRLRVSPDGRSLGSPEQLTTGAGQDIQPALAPGGRRLLFSVLQQNADVWRLPVDPMTGMPTGDPQPLVNSTREDSRASWSADGTVIAFNSDRDGEMNLWLRSLVDGSTRQLTHGPGGDYQPSWSPDGSRIAFFSARSGNADIWVVDVASAELHQLTRDPGLDVNPFFSPDGSSIAFQSDRGGRMELWTVAPDGTDLRQRTTGGVSGHFVVWSPDSRSIVFRTAGPGPRKIQRLELETGELEELPPVSSGAHMTFSPDRRLVMDAVGHESIWVYPVDGSPAREVFEFEEPDIRIDYPVWSPDGRWVLLDRVAPQGGDVWLLEGLD